MSVTDSGEPDVLGRTPPLDKVEALGEIKDYFQIGEGAQAASGAGEKQVINLPVTYESTEVVVIEDIQFRVAIGPNETVSTNNLVFDDESLFNAADETLQDLGHPEWRENPPDGMIVHEEAIIKLISGVTDNLGGTDEQTYESYGEHQGYLTLQDELYWVFGNQGVSTVDAFTQMSITGWVVELDEEAMNVAFRMLSD